MYCSKCQKEFDDDSVFCPICGSALEKTYDLHQETAHPQAPAYSNRPVASIAKKSNSLSLIAFILSGVVLLLAIISTIMMFIGAADMSTLSSIGGESLAEYYYQDHGLIYKGLSLFIFALGIFCSGVLSYIGMKFRIN